MQRLNTLRLETVCSAAVLSIGLAAGAVAVSDHFAAQASADRGNITVAETKNTDRNEKLFPAATLIVLGTLGLRYSAVNDQ